MTTPSSPSPAAAPANADAGGIKDTIESILIAFILAFVFRAFVVEAFVIPTGSMAPTLLGAHMRYTCEDCGYSFTSNYSSPGNTADDIVIPSAAGPTLLSDGRVRDYNFPVVCPNCGFQLKSGPGSQTLNPPVHYGDRILVLKYLYLLHPPQRWDVVVFKNPDDPSGEYATNYIKRLIGRPGESVMVLDGDVYVAPKDATDPKDFHVQTKPRYIQDALWRVVYDNDFHPHLLDRFGGRPWRQPWTPDPNSTGWDLGHDAVTGRTFRFDNPAGTAAIRFDPDANPSMHALTDWLAYDQNYTSEANSVVGDLKLSLAYTRHEGDGPLRLTLSKHDTAFTAELTPTGVRLLKQVGDAAQPVEIATAPLSLPAGRPVRVEFTNVDYRVALRVDDHDVFVTTPDQYAPDVAKLLADYPEYTTNPTIYPRPTVRIEAGQQRATLEHVAIHRDIYYTSRDGRMQWAMPRDFPNHVVRLSDTPGHEEFFVMGDNSLMSGDARYWNRPVDLPAEQLEAEGGRVPARFMLGKAFFVYWPAGFRPTTNAPGLIPNFGQMRFIH